MNRRRREEGGRGYSLSMARSIDVPEGQFWCPTCRRLIEAPKNPITCTTCGDDTTIAPQSARRKV